MLITFAHGFTFSRSRGLERNHHEFHHCLWIRRRRWQRVWNQSPDHDETVICHHVLAWRKPEHCPQERVIHCSCCCFNDAVYPACSSWIRGIPARPTWRVETPSTSTGLTCVNTLMLLLHSKQLPSLRLLELRAARVVRLHRLTLHMASSLLKFCSCILQTPCSINSTSLVYKPWTRSTKLSTSCNLALARHEETTWIWSSVCSTVCTRMLCMCVSECSLPGMLTRWPRTTAPRLTTIIAHWFWFQWPQDFPNLQAWFLVCKASCSMGY